MPPTTATLPVRERRAERVERSQNLDAPRGFRSREEFSDRVDPHLPLVFRTALRILPSDDLAWDAVQETLVRVWLAGWLPDEPGPALAHLAVRSSLHQRRCLQRRTHHERRARELTEPCCDEDPLAELESHERAEAVHVAVQRIQSEYRQVLELYEFEGQGYASIASRLDIPVGTVRSRLSRARRLLRDYLVAEAS